MSTTITNAHVAQYRNNVQIKYQQEGSMLRPWVRLEPTNARFHYFDLIAPTAAVKNTGRHADTPLVNSVHSRRRTDMDDFDWADLVDRQDAVRILIDPASAYVQNAVMALGRSIDESIIEAFNAAATEGESGGTSVTFPAGNIIGGGGGTAMSVDLLRQVKKFMDDGNVPASERYIAHAPEQTQRLLEETEVTSADFNTVRALVMGDVDTFLGFKFIQLDPDLLPLTGSVRQCFAWHRRAMGLAMGMDMEVDVSRRNDKRNSLQVYASSVHGAVRIEDPGVVQINCLEA